MEYNKYFILIIIIGTFSGILLAIFTNDLITYKETNITYLKNNTNNSNTNLTKEENKENIEEKIEETEDNEEEENEIINKDSTKEEEEKENIKEKEREKEKEEKENIKEKETQNINKNNNKTIIAVSYATDNKFIYPTIVSITSLVINAASNTFYNIYILHPSDFQESSKTFLNSVKEKYPDKCSIIYFNMGNQYKGLSLNFRITTPTYYRLSLQEILPDVNRIIYLDGDTFIFEDLTPLIELDMKGNVIMGFLDSVPDAIKYFGYKNPTVVCGGVLLMDLDGLRKYGYTKKISDFISNNINNLKQQDQTIINVVFQDRLAPIPPKYGIWAFGKKEDAKGHNDKQWPHLKYNENEFFEAYEHPAIVHFIWPKPFWRKQTRFYKEWWDMARATGFYDDIYYKSPIPNIHWGLI